MVLEHSYQSIVPGTWIAQQASKKKLKPVFTFLLQTNSIFCFIWTKYFLSQKKKQVLLKPQTSNKCNTFLKLSLKKWIFLFFLHMNGVMKNCTTLKILLFLGVLIRPSPHMQALVNHCLFISLLYQSSHFHLSFCTFITGGIFLGSRGLTLRHNVSALLKDPSLFNAMLMQ